MKKVLKVLAWIVGIAVVFIGITAAYVHFAPAPTYDSPTIPDLKVESTPERIAKGAKLASMQCVACHLSNDGKLSGKYMADAPKEFGKIYSMNITTHPEKGIGKWSDGELYAFLRTGLRKNGSFNGFMPNFPNMADEDVYAIIAWLHSKDPKLEPSERTKTPNELTFLSKALLKFVIKPVPMPAKPIALPDTTNQIAWGRYLANGSYDCYACHSASFPTNNSLEPAKSGGFYGGGNPLLDYDGNLVPSRNLTPDPETGIGNWTQEQFVEVMKTGRRPNGKIVRYPMMPYGMLTDNEIKAIYAYLKTIPPIKNEVKEAAL